MLGGGACATSDWWLWRIRVSKSGFRSKCAVCGRRMTEIFPPWYSTLRRTKGHHPPFFLPPVLLIRCCVIVGLYGTRCHYTAAWSGIDWKGWEEGDSSLRSLSRRPRELDETNRSNCICNKRLGISGARTTRSTWLSIFHQHLNGFCDTEIYSVNIVHLFEVCSLCGFSHSEVMVHLFSVTLATY